MVYTQTASVPWFIQLRFLNFILRTAKKSWNILMCQFYMNIFLEGRQKTTEITKFLKVPNFGIRGFSLLHPPYTFIMSY